MKLTKKHYDSLRIVHKTLGSAKFDGIGFDSMVPMVGARLELFDLLQEFEKWEKEPVIVEGPVFVEGLKPLKKGTKK